MLKLNSIPASVFEACDVDNSKAPVLKANSAGNTETTHLYRSQIISTGRLVVCEYFGNMVNNNPNSLEKYNSRLKDSNIDYASLSKGFWDKRFLFCANMAYKSIGAEPKTLEYAKNDYSLAHNHVFLRTMEGIDKDILTPIFFSVIDAVGMGLMQWDEAAMGRTTEITVPSNDVFLFEDSSWGSGRSTSKNYLYAKTITLTPKMYSTNATIKWYQDIVNGDAGRYYRAIIGGMYSKIYAKLIGAMDTAIAGGKYIPSGLTSETYSTQNWITITDKVAAVNGVRVDQLMAIGTRSALSNLLPVDGTGGAMTGLQYGIGEEWFKNGYLPKASGIDLFPVTPAIVPGTQNSTIQTIDTGDNIYIMAKSGYGYAPMRGVYAEGSPIILQSTPGGNVGTADFTIDINVGALFDIVPLFASKVGVIKSVYPTTNS